MLAGQLDRIGEPDVPTLTETFTSLTEKRRTALTTRGEQLRNRDKDLAAAQARLTGEREKIAAERDDAPPDSDLRPAGRSGRPGAPLWQLVRFADDLGEDVAAAVEGSLYGAGMLTAWIHPDPALTSAAVAEAEADGYLVALPPRARPGGRTLADVLVPEQQGTVPGAVVAGVLASVALAGDILNGSGSSAPAVVDGTAPAGPVPDGCAPGAVPIVTTRAQFSYGMHLGARPKPVPEFIGATNRAARRRARLAEIGQEIDAVTGQRDEVASELARAQSALSDLGRAPAGAAPDSAGCQLTERSHARRRAALRRQWRLEEARSGLDKSIAELDARPRHLRRAGSDRDMPITSDDVDAVERAVADFERAAEDLARARGETARLDEDLTGRRDRIHRLRTDNDEAAEVLAENESAHAAASAELRVAERVSGPEYQQIQAEITAADDQLRAARGETARRRKPGVGGARQARARPG